VEKVFMKIVLIAMFVWGVSTFAAVAEGKDGASVAGIRDQTGVAITIYNINLGLVKDQRNISLTKGTSELKFMDVAAQIIPASVSIKSLADPGSLRILEQNYEYDLLNPQKLLDKYVGKEVKLYSKNPYTEREEVVSATLLSNNGGPIFRIGDEITFGHPGRIIFPGVPADLISEPTLVWVIENDIAEARKVEATYLTNGINWRTDYVMTLNATDDKADLAGWVTVDNKSGATYKNASVKLIAGDVHRVREEPEYREQVMRMAKTETMGAPQFKEEAFFEYHIYTLQRPSTIKDNQTKQISLVSADNIPVRKELLLGGAKHYYYSQYGEMKKEKVGVFIEIQNREENNLGLPLPKGIVRVYKRDTEGSLQFTGEDSIDHTPKNEKVKIKLGDAFDLAASRRQTDWKKIASDTYEAGFEISLRNHKKEDVAVKVVEPIPGDWEILASSHEYRRTSAATAEFNLPVTKDSETKLTYRVRMRF